MADAPIRIERIQAKDLYKYACQIYDTAKEHEIIPIGKRRALAHANNPYVNKNDIGLLVAYEADQCIGYLGIMPGLLKIGEEFSRVHWLSTWFVPSEYRKTSVGLTLLLTALSFKHDLVVCGISEQAEKVYRGLRFREIGPLDYYIVDFELLNFLHLALRSLRKILREVGIKLEIPAAMIKLSGLLQAPLKKVIYGMLLHRQNGHTDHISYEEVDEIHEHDKPTDHNSTSPQFYRDTDAINWMLQYGWTKDADKVEIADSNYHFSEIRDAFRFITLKVYSADGRDYKGFLVLSFSAKDFNSVLKILDFCFPNCEDYQYIVLLAFKFASIHQANSIELPDSLVSYVKANPVSRIVLRKKKRVYLSHPENRHSPLATYLYDIDLNYCDGDTPFT